MDPQDLMNGREQAKARNAWLKSAEGKECLSGDLGVPYLQNRLTIAYRAGIDAALAHVVKRMQSKVRAQDEGTR